MKNIFIITISILMIFSMSFINVYAFEMTNEETLLSEISDEIKGMSSKMTEEYYLIKENQEELTEQQNNIIEQLESLNNTITIIMFSGIFVILLYFSREWLKIGMQMIQRGGKT